ncbi:MAG: thioredoxin-dependent peroxiredoxin [Chloroflexota bacterium]|nr:thioredoxin-dependent peroxiredoxin [Chloroflexota bacterium]
MIERKGIIQFKDRDVSIVGLDLEPGIDAQDFKVVDQKWQEINALQETRGKIRIIAAVPSLDTSVCDRETRRFNQEAAKLSDEIAILVISTDLPFAQARWCGAAGVDQVQVLSDHKYTDFGMKYSCLLSEPRILRRAVFIVDRQNVLRYADYMPQLSQEPNYAEVLETAKKLLGK